MNHILFHIPHSSLNIPKLYWNICIKDINYIKRSNLFLSDYLTDKLIPNKCNKLIFKYSRIFCDVEKFKDNSKEIMFKKEWELFILMIVTIRLLLIIRNTMTR